MGRLGTTDASTANAFSLLFGMNSPAHSRSTAWRWGICVLLLCASTINYMDRVTLSTVATRITREFGLSQEQYGSIETGFGLAFAVGSLFFGLLADRFPVRWVYPIALTSWSAMGVLAGFSRNYGDLFFCRLALGFFEGGHWPCAIKTTRLLLESKDRSMGNSVLQSGTSIGAIATPLVMRVLLTSETGSWRSVFQGIGAIGLIWVVAWFGLIRSRDLAVPVSLSAAPPVSEATSDRLRTILLSRRMLVVVLVIALINTSWQLMRAWLPKILVEGRGYTEGQMLLYLPFFYLATDCGVIGAGVATLSLHRRGSSVHTSRLISFGVCSALSALAVVASTLPHGTLLLIVVALTGAGALGVFPIYHSLTQEFPIRFQGTISGLGGVAAWIFSPVQKYYGRWIDISGSFDAGFALAGLMPCIAFVILWTLWHDASTADDSPSATL